MLVEQLRYNLLFRWFVGLGMNEEVWHATVFTKNRDRLLAGEVAREFFAAVVRQARQQGLMSSEHFSVDGTMLEAWASQKSFRPKQGESSEHGPGKLWARLRVRDVRTSMRRVLQLMRQNHLLAPQRQPQPVGLKRHEGTILAERPNQMWGIDATVGFPLADGRVTIFAMVDHATAECLGIHVARRGTRFEALEPVRRAMHEQFGGFAEDIALGLKLRPDHGSQFMSDDFQNEIAFLGIASSPAFVREPEGNGCIERFFRTLKEQLLWVRNFTTLEDLAEALEEFRQRYNDHWLLERLSFQSPRQARQRLLALEAAP
jgi:transposase InsO family protein